MDVRSWKYVFLRANPIRFCIFTTSNVAWRVARNQDYGSWLDWDNLGNKRRCVLLLNCLSRLPVAICSVENTLLTRKFVLKSSLFTLIDISDKVRSMILKLIMERGGGGGGNPLKPGGGRGGGGGGWGGKPWKRGWECVVHFSFALPWRWKGRWSQKFRGRIITNYWQASRQHD